MSKMESNALITMFDTPGWRIMVRILEKDKSEIAENTLGDRSKAERTLNGWGFAQGQFSQCNETIEYEAATRAQYEAVFAESESNE